MMLGWAPGPSRCRRGRRRGRRDRVRRQGGGGVAGAGSGTGAAVEVKATGARASGAARAKRRRPGLIAPSRTAPATQIRPPETTEIVVENSWATTPASTLPRAGALLTWARYRLETRPRSWSGV